MRIAQNSHVIFNHSVFAEPNVGQSVGAGC